MNLAWLTKKCIFQTMSQHPFGCLFTFMRVCVISSGQRGHTETSEKWSGKENSCQITKPKETNHPKLFYSNLWQKGKWLATGLESM